jgi:hypothetical protein
MRAVDHVVERFPERMDAIRRLYLRDEQFRAACEDFALSICSLRRFEARPDAHLRPEVDDYLMVVRELEKELCSYLSAAEDP